MPKLITNAEMKAALWARDLIAEGWPPELARERARQAFGLEPMASCSYEPKLSRDWMRRMREEMGAARPGMESPTKSEALQRKELRRAEKARKGEVA